MEEPMGLRVLVQIIALAMIGATTSSLVSDSITPDQFTKLHALIKPKASEQKWEQIPWLVSLGEARQRGAAEGKPVLLWEMDGHPLGCT
jgi:hypothetical protein